MIYNTPFIACPLQSLSYVFYHHHHHCFNIFDCNVVQLLLFLFVLFLSFFFLLFYDHVNITLKYRRYSRMEFLPRKFLSGILSLTLLALSISIIYTRRGLIQCLSFLSMWNSAFALERWMNNEFLQDLGYLYYFILIYELIILLFLKKVKMILFQLGYFFWCLIR